MLKTSKFNTVSPCQDVLLVFNSYSGALVSVKTASALASFLNGQKAVLNADEQAKLVQYGLAAESNMDEDRRAEMKLYDFIYDQRLELVILPTLQCNFRCSYCYEKFDNKIMTNDAADDIILYLRRNLNRYRGLSITWFGGEPLLALPQMERISEEAIRLCGMFKIPYNAFIVTNGSLLTPPVMDKLLKMRIYQMQITLDGTQADHDKTRKLMNGSGSFDTIFQNLLSIRDYVKSPALNISVRCNVSNANINGLENYLDQMGQCFGQDNRFQFYFQPVEDWGGDTVKGFQEELLRNPEVFFQILSRYETKVNIGDNFKQLKRHTLCHSIKRNHYIIMPDLELKKCTVDLYSPQNHIGCLKNGKLMTDEDKEAAWCFQTLPLHSSCKSSCALYANCFTRTCPARTFGKDIVQCPANAGELARKLCLEYRYSRWKFVQL